MSPQEEITYLREELQRANKEIEALKSALEEVNRERVVLTEKVIALKVVDKWRLGEH